MTEGRGDGSAWILAIDTATTRVVLAAGRPDGSLIATRTWEAGYRHGETLLPAIGELIRAETLDRGRLAGVVVGTGPGAFTGLRVGIATAKGLAHALAVPISGISTGEALLEASASGDGGATALAVLGPAGPADRVLMVAGEAARLLPAGTEPDLPTGTRLVAIDLPGRAPEDAIERGERARAGLGEALVRLGARRLERDGGDDLARLVPEYVTLPRGVAAQAGEVTWSRGLR